jgi:hypothetical protein
MAVTLFVLQRSDFPVTRILWPRRMMREATGFEARGIRLKLTAEAVD